MNRRAFLKGVVSAVGLMSAWPRYQVVTTAIPAPEPTVDVHFQAFCESRKRGGITLPELPREVGRHVYVTSKAAR